MRLVLIAHAVPDVEPAYRTALAPFGPVTVKPFISPHPGMSSSYVSLAHALRNGGRVLPNLIARYAPGNWDSVVLVTWSAGYALARELLSIAADFADLDGLVMLDSLHCSSEINASTSQLTPFMHYASAAMAGKKVLFVGHSDVPTQGYMSTTKAAKQLVKLAGEPLGGFMVRAYDTVPGVTAADYQREHRNALRLWGPSAAAEAVGKLANLEAAPDTDRTPPRNFTPVTFAFDAGLAVLEVAKLDLNTAIRESWAHNDGPEIRALYLEPLGLPVGSSYCAAAVTSWIRRATSLYGIKASIVGSGSAKAIMAELQRAGCWIPAAKMVADDVRPGCLLIWDRSTPGKPETNWMGHVAIVADRVGNSAFTVEANADLGRETDAVAMNERRLNDPKLLGVGYLGSVTPPPIHRDIV